MPSSQISLATGDPNSNYSYRTRTSSGSITEVSDLTVMRDEVETVRDAEYPQLKGKVYLDHAGTTLYAKSLVDAFSADLVGNLYGNPHSESLPSAFAGHKIDGIREQALRFFNADPKHWDLIFVPNATAAIKLAVECFRDCASQSKSHFWYGYHKDAHTSLVGGRSMASKHRCFTTDEEVDQWVRAGCKSGKRMSRGLGLFAYPGQSNMTGRRLPLDWCSRIRGANTDRTVYTLLDAAALATTSPLHLEDPTTSPDMVALSFYKIFGFPNLGALLVQKSCQHVLECKRYFGGGTVEMVTAINDSWHAKKTTSLHDQLEDGTLPFHSIFALGHALNTHESIYGPDPMSYISQHTALLVGTLFRQLDELKHSNGRPVIQFYKDPKSMYGDTLTQGATIALNVVRTDGSLVGYADVEKEADKSNIYVRSGSLCNPGGVATHLGWSPEQMKRAYAAGHRCSNPTQSVFGKPTGVVRVSLAAMSTMSDVEAFVNFIRSTYHDASSCKKSESAIILIKQIEVQPHSAVMTLPSRHPSGWKSILRCFRL